MKILFVDIDTLRPDHMGCYGYSRNTTPNIDLVAKESLKFNNCYCADAPCLPSRAGLISGMFGIHNGAVGHGGTAADKRYMGEQREFRSEDDQNNFNFIFRKAGMYTASISTFPERHSSWWFSAGFNETYNVGKNGLESGEEVLPVALDWIKRNIDRNDWFLHIHFWDPHTPYRAPAEFGNPFENESLDTWINDEILGKHLKYVGPHSINELNMFDDNESKSFPRYPGKATDMKGVKRIIDGYDCGVRYVDYLIGRIFDELKSEGIYEDTAIIVTSDHGENLGELGIYSEHATADHATCHIPLIIKWPNGMTGTDDSFHYNIDLTPTMAELLKVEAYRKWDGKSYAKTIINGENSGQKYLILSQMAHVCQRSVRFDDWLYMRTYNDGFHLFDKEMLFNIKNDPCEQKDLKTIHPELCEKGCRYLLNWQDNMMVVSESTIDPLWTVMSEGDPYHAKGYLEKYMKRLRNTGRGEGADILYERHINGKYKF